MEPEEQKKIEESERIKRLAKSEDFKELLVCLALRIKELDTVRDIDNTKINYRNIAVEQLARKKAIEIIEQWLDDILGIINYNDFIDENIEKTNDIVRRFK